jgi:molybdopterin synthase catalytic subunit
MRIIRVQHARFDAGAELAALMALGGGAIASFTGLARGDMTENGRITALEIEQYPAMTRPALEALVSQAEARWDLTGCIVIHRVGRIAVGEEIVLVGTASSHRNAALSAVSFLMDRLKSDIPFWKKEYRDDGQGQWVNAKGSDEAAANSWD